MNISTITPDYFIDNFIEFIKRDSANGRPAQDTLNTYTSNIKQFFIWCYSISNQQPLSCTPEDIKEYRNYLWEKRQLRVSTVSLKLTAIRRFFEAALVRGLISINPANDVYAGEDPMLNLQTTRYLDEDKLQKLINLLPKDGIRNLRARAIIVLMGLQGLRTVEIHRASVEDIDFNTGVMLVRGKKRDGRVYLRQDTVNLLITYLKVRGFAQKDDRGTPLFISIAYHNKGGRISRCGVRDIIDRLFTQAGIKTISNDHLSCHLLRHSCGTNLYLRTKDLRVVQEVLRHKKIDTTTKYAHIHDQMEKRYTEQIDIDIL